MSTSSMPISTVEHPASVALVLSSGFYDGPQDQLIFSTTSLAAASDGSIWLGAGSLYVYSASEGSFVPASSWPTFGSSRDGYGAYLAPVNARLAYFMTTQNGPVSIACWSNGATAGIAALPVPDVPVGISASADGTLWAVGGSGRIYAYDATGDRWDTVAPPPGRVASLSVANASTAFALTTEGNGGTLYRYANGAWTQPSTVCPPGASWIGACVDGSYWVAAPIGLVLVLPDGGSKVFIKPSDVTIVGGYAAASRYGCYFITFTTTPQFRASIALAGYGVTEQPPESWPAMNAGESAAYAAIGTKLSIIDPAGVRGTYTNLNAPLSAYLSRIGGWQTAPPGIDEADWDTVRRQLELELEFAIGVQLMFNNLGTLNEAMATIQTDELSSVFEDVGLPDDPDQLPESPVEVFLGALVSTLFTAAVLGATPEVQQTVAVGESIYNFAASEIAKRHGVPNRDAALRVACAKLAATLAEMYTAVTAATTTFEQQILSDWGMLRACGLSIASNVWYWPPDYEPSVLAGAGAANALLFYQTLMPVKWQIVQVETVFTLGTGGLTGPPYVPLYATLSQQIGSSSSGDLVGWWQIIVDQGVSPDPYTRGPFPNHDLVESVMALTDPQDFFTNAKGWQFPVVTMAGYQPPPAGTPYFSWIDSKKFAGD